MRTLPSIAERRAQHARERAIGTSIGLGILIGWPGWVHDGRHPVDPRVGLAAVAGVLLVAALAFHG